MAHFFLSILTITLLVHSKKKDLSRPLYIYMLRSLPPVVTFNKTLPNIKNILLMNTGIFLLFMKFFKKLLEKKPLISYRRNRNLHQIIGDNHILKNKVIRLNDRNHTGKCLLCVSRLNIFRCKQVKLTNLFTIYRTNQVFEIFQDLTWKSGNFIYLL